MFKLRPDVDKFLLMILIAAAVIRCFNLSLPLLDTRQAYNAMVAKNYYENGFNLFYPFMPIRGNSPFVQTLEFPIIPYVGAIFYWLIGGIHTEILRLISVFFTVLTILFLYRLANSSYDKRIAQFSVFLFAFSPISIYIGKSALYEMPMIFFIICCIYYFINWTKSERISDALLANLCFVFAVLIKKPNLYLLMPLSYLAYSKWGWNAIRKNWIAFFSLFLILTWNLWEVYLRMQFPDPQWLHFNFKYNISRIIFSYSSVDFYKKIYADSVNYVLTPLGITFLLLGLFLKPNKKIEFVLYFWLGAVILFYLIMPEQVWAHGYYHIHYLPIAAFFAAKGFQFIIKRDYSKFYFLKPRSIMIIFGLLFILLSARYFIPFYSVPENKKFVLKTAEFVKEKIPPNELIISCVDSPATLLYYSDRKGWPVDFSYKGEEGISILEDLRTKGASYFVCAYKKELMENKEFVQYLTTYYTTIFENGFCLIVDLRKQK